MFTIPKKLSQQEINTNYAEIGLDIDNEYSLEEITKGYRKVGRDLLTKEKFNKCKAAYVELILHIQFHRVAITNLHNAMNLYVALDTIFKILPNISETERKFLIKVIDIIDQFTFNDFGIQVVQIDDVICQIKRSIHPEHSCNETYVLLKILETIADYSNNLNRVYNKITYSNQTQQITELSDEREKVYECGLNLLKQILQKVKETTLQNASARNFFRNKQIIISFRKCIFIR